MLNFNNLFKNDQILFFCFLMEKQTFYEILECNPDASTEEIKKSYHNLILKYHPDKQNKTESKEFIIINQAWEVLRSADKRRAYNAELLQAQFNDQAIVYEILSPSDFRYDSSTETYCYSCRCGGLYYLPEFKDDTVQPSESEELFIECDECSLVVQLKR